MLTLLVQLASASRWQRPWCLSHQTGDLCHQHICNPGPAFSSHLDGSVMLQRALIPARMMYNLPQANMLHRMSVSDFKVTQYLV